MFPADDMVHLVWEFSFVLVEETILASIFGAFPHRLASNAGHC